MECLAKKGSFFDASNGNGCDYPTSVLFAGVCPLGSGRQPLATNAKKKGRVGSAVTVGLQLPPYPYSFSEPLALAK